VAFALRDAFLDLGLDCDFAGEPDPARVNVLLGSNLLGATEPVPEQTIVYNLEQLSTDSPWVTPVLLDLFQRFPVWDFNRANIRYLSALGIGHALHVPVGALRGRAVPASEAERTFDVAIIGAESKRRLRVARALSAAELKVVYAVHVWGDERDELIRKSRILLNVHTCTAALLETTRLNLFLARSAFIVSEDVEELDARAAYSGRVIFSTYDRLVETCVKYARDPAAREAVIRQSAKVERPAAPHQALIHALANTPLDLRAAHLILRSPTDGARDVGAKDAIAFLLAERRFRTALDLLARNQTGIEPRVGQLFRGMLDHFLNGSARRSPLIGAEHGLSAQAIVALSANFRFPSGVSQPPADAAPLRQRFLRVVAEYFLASRQPYEAAAVATALLAESRSSEYVELLGDCYASWAATSAAERCYCIALKTLPLARRVDAPAIVKKIRHLPRRAEDADSHLAYLLESLPPSADTARLVMDILWQFERCYEAAEIAKKLAQASFDDAGFLSDAAEKLIRFGHHEVGTAVAARAAAIDFHHPGVAAAIAAMHSVPPRSELPPEPVLGFTEALELTARLGETLSATELVAYRGRADARDAARIPPPSRHVVLPSPRGGELPAWVARATRFAPSAEPEAHEEDSSVCFVALSGARSVDEPLLHSVDELAAGHRATVLFDPRRRVAHDGQRFCTTADAALRPYRYAFNGPVVVADAKLPTARVEPANVLVILACYNERDIIPTALEALLSEGVKVWVIDNWSDDGTWEILQRYAAQDRITLERFPAAGPSGVYEWSALLSRKEEIATLFPGYWIVHQDADEVRRSPWHGVGLREAFGVADSYGANCVPFTVLNFKPVDNGFNAGLDAEAYFSFFEFAETTDYQVQLKAWKQGSVRIDLASTGGHQALFANRRIFPYRFLLKHYPLRGDAHALRKIRRDRMQRFSANERAMGWHTHYDGVVTQETFVVDWKQHRRFDASFYEERLAERLVGSRGAIWRK
jgi:hypothetical protein